MKNIIRIVCFCVAFCFVSQAMVAPVSAAPFVQEKDELEKMILKKIEERRKEMEAEKAKKGTSSSSSKARPTRSTPSANRAVPGRPVRSKSATPALSPSIKAARAAEMSGSSPKVTAPSRVRPTEKDPQYTQPTEMNIPAPSGIDPNVKITFSFQDEEWKEILDWFAEEIGYGLFYGQTGAPVGTHSYVDPNEYTLIEALDKLNSWLSLMQPSHVLVRNGNLLFLINESDVIPDGILAFITPSKLKDYSEYEVVRCKFDLGELNGNVLTVQLRENISEVHLDGFAYIEAANTLVIRERVRVLREIAAIIKDATPTPGPIATYQFAHADPETALVTIRQMMGIEEGANELADGSLRLSLSAGNEKVYLIGSPDKVQEFMQIAKIIDVPIDAVETEVPYFQKHSVSGDIEVVFQIIQTILDGEPNVRMDQDTVTGDVYILGVKRIHDEVSQLLESMSSVGKFDIVKLNNIRPSDAVDTVEELLGIDTFAEDTGNQPRLIADADHDEVYVYGSPQQKVEIREMLEKLDQTREVQSTARNRTRIIRMSARDADNVINYLEIDGIMESLGRKNRLIILPEERRNRSQRPAQPEAQPATEGSGNRNGTRTKINNRTTTKVEYVQRSYYVSTVQQLQDPFDGEIGQVTGSDDEPAATNQNPEINIPGSDIFIRRIDQGIVITADDLDAGDAIEDLVDEIIEGNSLPELPQFIGIEFRDANEVKGLLDHILGLSSSSGGGGGGGGLGNLIGGAMSNAIGGGAGDAVNNLLGLGGDSGFSDSTEGAVELEGEDVSITVDGRANTLIVIGATTNDLDFIIELVNVVDVDSPAHRPNLLGETYVIHVDHRDPMDVKEKVETQLAKYFNTGPANAGGNGQQNPEAAIQRAVLQSIQGGGRRGGQRGNNAAGGGANGGSQAPKATLGIDEENSNLLLTGPEYIYDAVFKLVKELDIEKTFHRSIVRPEFISSDALVKMIKDAYGDKVDIIDGDEEETTTGAQTGGGNGANRGNGARNAGRNNAGNPSQAELTRRIQDAVRSRGGGTGRGGGGRGGAAGRARR